MKQFCINVLFGVLRVLNNLFSFPIKYEEEFLNGLPIKMVDIDSPGFHTLFCSYGSVYSTKKHEFRAIKQYYYQPWIFPWFKDQMKDNIIAIETEDGEYIYLVNPVDICRRSNLQRKGLHIFDDGDKIKLVAMFKEYECVNGKLVIRFIKQKFVINTRTAQSYLLPAVYIGNNKHVNNNEHITNITYGLPSVMHMVNLFTYYGEESTKVLKKFGRLLQNKLQQQVQFKVPSPDNIVDNNIRENGMRRIMTLLALYNRFPGKIDETFLSGLKLPVLSHKASYKRFNDLSGEIVRHEKISKKLMTYIKSSDKPRDMFSTVLLLKQVVSDNNVILDVLTTLQHRAYFTMTEVNAEIIKNMVNVMKQMKCAIKDTNHVETILGKRLAGCEYSICGGLYSIARLIKQLEEFNVSPDPSYFDDNLSNIDASLSVLLRKVKSGNYTLCQKHLSLEDRVNNFSFILPKDSYDLIDYGLALDNCVGGYGERINRGDCIIVKVLKDSKPFACVEIDNTGRFLRQCKKRFNERININEAHPIIEWLGKYGIKWDCCEDIIFYSDDDFRYEVQDEWF